MIRWLPLATLLLTLACSSSSDAPPVVRLVDTFATAHVIGTESSGSTARTE